MELNSISNQISSLKDTVTLIDSTVKFHLTVQWAVLAFVIAASGWALYLMAKNWFEQGLEERIKSLNEELIKSIDEKIPKLETIILGVNSTTSGKNAVKVEIVNSVDNITPKVFIQPRGKYGDVEVSNILGTNDYIVINKKHYYLMFDVLVINGSVKSGKVSQYSEEEARETFYL